MRRADGQPVTVLVVDDEPVLAEMVSMALRYEGWNIATAGEGAPLWIAGHEVLERSRAVLQEPVTGVAGAGDVVEGDVAARARDRELDALAVGATTAGTGRLEAADDEPVGLRRATRGDRDRRTVGRRVDDRGVACTVQVQRLADRDVLVVRAGGDDDVTVDRDRVHTFLDRLERGGEVAVARGGDARVDVAGRRASGLEVVGRRVRRVRAGADRQRVGAGLLLRDAPSRRAFGMRRALQSVALTDQRGPAPSSTAAGWRCCRCPTTSSRRSRGSSSTTRGRRSRSTSARCRG